MGHRWTHAAAGSGLALILGGLWLGPPALAHGDHGWHHHHHRSGKQRAHDRGYRRGYRQAVRQYYRKGHPVYRPIVRPAYPVVIKPRRSWVSFGVGFPL